MAKKVERISQYPTQPVEHPVVATEVAVSGEAIAPEHGPHHDDHEDEHTHHVSMGAYFLVFGALMVLLALTVGAYHIDLGIINTPLAVSIAAIKAMLIVAIFMHAIFSSRLVQIAAITGFIFVGIMFVLTFNDYLTRNWLPIAGRY